MLPYDAEIEYLESTGTQYIDTGIKFHETDNINYRIDVKVYVYSTASNYSCIINNMYEKAPYPGTVLRYKNNKVTSEIGSQNSIIIGNTNTVLNISYSPNDNRKHNVSSTLFAGYDSKMNPWRFCKLKLYYCKLWNRGELVRDYIPVIKDGVGYLYDKVSKRMFGNDGTGNFIAGPIIN